MFSKVNSLGIEGLSGYPVSVECDLQTKALPGFEIVGLPDLAVKESKNRVSSALKNTGFQIPSGKITVNLAPADVKKNGSLYDLPIAVAILISSGKYFMNLEKSAFIGEVSLSGELHGVTGMLSMVIEARERGFEALYLPSINAKEASIIDGITIFPVSDLKTLYNHLAGTTPISPLLPATFDTQMQSFPLDFADVKGQEGAKRALEIAAAGAHNILLIGSPGSGKSMLSKCLPSILPPLSFEEAIETTKIYSVAGMIDKENPLIRTRPFRTPHHNISGVALSGGGSVPKPGEVSLAHNGVLFLDELPEFARGALEVLRQPIEDREITISRSRQSATYPTSVMVVAAMNPCPCGYYGHPKRECSCSQNTVSRYLSKISGPLLDRLDLHIEVAPVEFSSLSSTKKSEHSVSIQKRVTRARELQRHRYANHEKIYSNAAVSGKFFREEGAVDKEALSLLEKAFDKMGLSARAYDKILKIARSIADLDQCENIQKTHIGEALQYRSLDRKYWAN